MSQTDKKLEMLGITLPKKDRRGKGMVAIRQVDDLLFISGHGPQTADGKPLYVGKVGSDITKEQAYEAARQCGINILAAIREYIGDLDRVDKVIKVFGLVACAPDFYEQPFVMHGFSDLMVEVLGDRGLHARSAMGTNSLPGNIPVEVEAIVRIRA